MEWTGMQWNALEWTGKDWNGLEWIRMELTGTGWNKIEKHLYNSRLKMKYTLINNEIRTKNNKDYD